MRVKTKQAAAPDPYANTEVGQGSDDTKYVGDQEDPALLDHLVLLIVVALVHGLDGVVAHVGG